MGFVKQVHIDLAGHRGVAVAQRLADAEHRDILAVGDTGEAVPQAMERALRQVILAHKSGKKAGEIIRGCIRSSSSLRSWIPAKDNRRMEEGLLGPLSTATPLAAVLASQI